MSVHLIRCFVDSGPCHLLKRDGGHLFAIACQVSLESGCDGFVAFTAKSDLITHYQKVLNAQVARGQRMYIDEAAADILMEKYIRK